MILAETEERLRELMRFFLAENEQINLTALRTPEACWIGNILDSLAALDVIADDAKTLIDVGTGGGFPLLPLAIAKPELTLTGIDSTNKKLEAIKRIAAKTHITNIRLIHERSEVLGQKKDHRETYDVVTARAVAPLNILLEYCSPFVHVKGQVILWKSLHIDEELKQAEKAMHEVRLDLIKQHRYTLPGDFGERQLLIFQKNSPLPRMYPREVGMAKTKPIL